MLVVRSMEPGFVSWVVGSMKPELVDFSLAPFIVSRPSPSWKTIQRFSHACSIRAENSKSKDFTPPLPEGVIFTPILGPLLVPLSCAPDREVALREPSPVAYCLEASRANFSENSFTRQLGE